MACLIYSTLLCWYVQEMVTVETFVEFIRKKDVGRIRFAIRETLYDLDATDEVCRLHGGSKHSDDWPASQKIRHYSRDFFYHKYGSRKNMHI